MPALEKSRHIHGHTLWMWGDIDELGHLELFAALKWPGTEATPDQILQNATMDFSMGMAKGAFPQNGPRTVQVVFKRATLAASEVMVILEILKHLTIWKHHAA